MKATLKNFYKKDGEYRGVYTVSGTPEELANYKAAQGEYYQEEEGNPLYFTKNISEGKSFNLAISSNNNVYIKKSNDQIIAEAQAEAQMLKQAKATIQAKMSWGIALVEED